MLKQWIVFFVRSYNGYSKSGYQLLFRSQIHLHLLSHKLRVMLSRFAALTNKEISQIIKQAFPEIHEG